MITRVMALLMVGLLTQTAGYQPVPHWPQLPAGLELGQASAVATDSRGNVFVFHRGARAILVFEPGGKFLREFNHDRLRRLGFPGFKSAHGLRIDKDDNVWVTDNAAHIVVKFDQGGTPVLTLGTRDEAGEDEKHFNKPTDIAFAANGDFFISDGYGNSRVVKFDKTGKYLLTWGKKGSGPGEFNLPHNIRLDSKGRVVVADRENNRVQIFDQNGNFLSQFGGMAPFGLALVPNRKDPTADRLLVADGRAHKVWAMTLEGKIIESFGSQGKEPGQFDLPHGIHVAADGALYVSEITGKRVQKFLSTAGNKPGIKTRIADLFPR